MSSYKTLKKLKEVWNSAELYIICGEDVYNEIKEWKNSEWILENFKLLPVSRDVVSISSSKIRELIKNKEDTYPFIEDKVKQIIKINDLYI